MLNPIYQLDIVEQNIYIYNKYHLKKPLYILRNINNANAIKDYILNSKESTKNNSLLNQLYKRGVIVHPADAFLISSVSHIIDELKEETISKAYLSVMLVEKLLTSTFTLINLHQKTNAFFKLLTQFSKRDNDQYHHYIVIYQDIEELRSLRYLSLSSKNQTLFLCKYSGEEIAEIGPFYQINHEFCFDCLANNMKKNRNIQQTELLMDYEELLKSEYLFSVIDYFLHNKTWFSSIQERKITVNGNLGNYSTLIPPINPACTCLINNEYLIVKEGI